MANSLQHYGVLGMKWGIRRYQPYPSGAKKGVYLGDSVGHAPLEYKSPLLRTIVNEAKYGLNYGLAMVVPGYALVYNANTIHDYVKYNLDGRNYSKKEGSYEQIKELSKKPSKTSAEEDVRFVNRGNAAGQVNNCGYCTATMEMRRRGYDVRARKKAQGITVNQYSDWFDGVRNETSYVARKSNQSRKEWANENYDALCRELEKKGNGSRGYVAFEYERSHTGHTLFWEVQNGSVTFYDGQTGKKNPGDLFSFSNQRYMYARLDNCKLKPAVTETCISMDYKEKHKGEKK